MSVVEYLSSLDIEPTAHKHLDWWWENSYNEVAGDLTTDILREAWDEMSCDEKEHYGSFGDFDQHYRSDYQINDMVSEGHAPAGNAASLVDDHNLTHYDTESDRFHPACYHCSEEDIVVWVNRECWNEAHLELPEVVDSEDLIAILKNLR